MKRREFLKKLSIGSLGLSLGGHIFSSPDAVAAPVVAAAPVAAPSAESFSLFDDLVLATIDARRKEFALESISRPSLTLRRLQELEDS